MINSEFKKLINENPEMLSPDVFNTGNNTPKHNEENYSNYDNNFIEKTRHVNSARKNWSPLMFRNFGITI